MLRFCQKMLRPSFNCPGSTYEAYLQENVDKKQRHEIRRKQRRAERETAVHFDIVGLNPASDADRLEQEMTEFIALQKASAVDKAEFMTPLMERFFARLPAA